MIIAGKLNSYQAISRIGACVKRIDNRLPELTRVTAHLSNTGSLYLIVQAEVANPELAAMVKNRLVRVSNHKSGGTDLYGSILVPEGTYSSSAYGLLFQQVCEIVKSAAYEIAAEVSMFRQDLRRSKASTMKSYGK